MEKLFKYIGFTEGSSFLVLLFIAMPLKYFWEFPIAVRIVGILHGVFFLIYIFAASLLAFRLKWSTKKLFLAYIASVLPFGPFIFEARLSNSKNLETKI